MQNSRSQTELQAQIYTLLLHMNIGIDAHMLGSRETGNERYILELLRALVRFETGDTFYVVVQDPQSVPSEIRDQRHVRILPLPSRSQAIRLLVDLPRMAAEHRLDVLHVTYNAPWMCSCPIVVTVHDICYEKHPNLYSLRDRWLLKTLVPRSVRIARRVIAVSEATKNDLVRFYSLAPEKVVVTHEAAGKQFQPSSQEEILRVCRKYSIHRPYILMLGTRHPRKNLDRAVRAFRQATRSLTGARTLVIGGPGPAGCQDGVIYTGYVAEDDLPALYSGAEVFLFPSLYEGFGLPVLEAMACGTPVVASNVDAVREVAGSAALLVDPCDDASLIGALQRMLSGDGERDSLAESGRDHAAGFSWGRTAARTLEVYRDASGIFPLA